MKAAIILARDFLAFASAVLVIWFTFYVVLP